MRTTLITAVAAASLLAGTSMVLAQGGDMGREGGAGGMHERGAGGGGMNR
ncbi:hypothetical protein RHAL1_04155 [Beijerinckiaceae bacterium RH AL1]|nr:hypothetical protein RHCH11_RHCH11_04077 [Beijerinckiaceae bacterium RH CH11]VVB50134.1 hypothetical protein RHAL8_04074 [Beijerinckiaceae bacterium RH AL8]VVC57215.1 hypothetical protein RHAL1_04155 [Beijerinckiaceae bacterium RH AL1]